MTTLDNIRLNEIASAIREVLSENNRLSEDNERLVTDNQDLIHKLAEARAEQDTSNLRDQIQDREREIARLRSKLNYIATMARLDEETPGQNLDKLRKGGDYPRRVRD